VSQFERPAAGRCRAGGSNPCRVWRIGLLEAGRLGLELELTGVFADDIGIGETALGLGLDFQRYLHLGALDPLKLQDDRVQGRLESLDRPNQSILTDP
jgi:hypothetical protein